MIESIGIASEKSLGQSIGNSSLGQAELFKVLLTQLSFQDPLKPLDNREFITQLAQFTDLEVNRDVSDRITNLLSMQSVSQSMGLLGKRVEIETDLGNKVLGEVFAISLQGGVPKATIRSGNGDVIPDVSLSKITLLQDKLETN